MPTLNIDGTPYTVPALFVGGIRALETAHRDHRAKNKTPSNYDLLKPVVKDLGENGAILMQQAIAEQQQPDGYGSVAFGRWMSTVDGVFAFLRVFLKQADPDLDAKKIEELAERVDSNELKVVLRDIMSPPDTKDQPPQAGNPQHGLAELVRFLGDAGNRRAHCRGGLSHFGLAVR